MSRIDKLLRKHAKPKAPQPPAKAKVSDAEWLAANDLNRKLVDTPALEVTEPTIDQRVDHALFNHFLSEHERNELHDVRGTTPGLVGLSTRPEPKTIHDPVYARLAFERPKRRSGPKAPFIF